jgi:hypothetical protein
VWRRRRGEERRGEKRRPDEHKIWQMGLSPINHIAI